MEQVLIQNSLNKMSKNKYLISESRAELFKLIKAIEHGREISNETEKFIKSISGSKVNPQKNIIYTNKESEEIVRLLKGGANENNPRIKSLLDRLSNSKYLTGQLTKKLLRDYFSKTGGPFEPYFRAVLFRAMDSTRLSNLKGKPISQLTKDDYLEYFKDILKVQLTARGISSELHDDIIELLTIKFESSSEFKDFIKTGKRVLPIQTPQTAADWFFKKLESKGILKGKGIKRGITRSKIYALLANAFNGIINFIKSNIFKRYVVSRDEKISRVNDALLTELESISKRIEQDNLENIDAEEYSALFREFSSRYKRQMILAYDLDENLSKIIWNNVKSQIQKSAKEQGINIEIDTILKGIEEESNNNSKLSILNTIELTSPSKIGLLDGAYTKGRGFDAGAWSRFWSNFKEKYFPDVVKLEKDQLGKEVGEKIRNFAWLKLKSYMKNIWRENNLPKKILAYSTYGNIRTIGDITALIMKGGSRNVATVAKNILFTYLRIVAGHFFVQLVVTYVKSVILNALESWSGNDYTTRNVKDEMWNFVSERFMSGYSEFLKKVLNPFHQGIIPELATKGIKFLWNLHFADAGQKIDASGKILLDNMKNAGLDPVHIEEFKKERLKLLKEKSFLEEKLKKTENENEQNKIKYNITQKENKLKYQRNNLTKKVELYKLWKKDAQIAVDGAKLIDELKVKHIYVAINMYTTNNRLPKPKKEGIISGVKSFISPEKENQAINKYLESRWEDNSNQNIINAAKTLSGDVKNSKVIFFEFPNKKKWIVKSIDRSINNPVLDFQEAKSPYGKKNITDFYNELKANKLINENNFKNKISNIISEMNEGKKFGEDNFKHWKDTFKFKKYDEKTNHLKDVKITAKMDEIMDRIDHFRKKYDEDDSFVRAVIDVYGTGIDIIQYTKGLAHLTEGVIVGGLLGVLSTIRESKELVTWTVKHYKDGNWELVKGNFNKKELLNVGKTKRERDERQKESDNPAEGLKKKEQESIMILSRDEKEGLNGLPTKVKQKVKEKLRQGWTTEKPFDFLNTYYSESEINSVFNDKIKIYKLKPSAEFFRSLAKNSSKVTVKKGFCKSVKNAKGEYDLSEREKNTLNHFISKCESKFGV